MNEGPTIEAGYIEELRSALEKAEHGGWVDRDNLSLALYDRRHQLLSDARLGQLIREGGEAVVEKVARAITSVSGYWGDNRAWVRPTNEDRACAVICALQELSDER